MFDAFEPRQFSVGVVLYDECAACIAVLYCAVL